MGHQPKTAVGFVTSDGVPVPVVTADEMRRLDAQAERAGYRLEQMVEHAGRHLADLATALGAWPGGAPRTVVLAGSGGNAAGVLVAARHIANAGGQVTAILTTEPEDAGAAVSGQLGLLALSGATALGPSAVIPADADLVLDGLVGYGLLAALRGPHRKLVEQLHSDRGPREALVLSLDIPSGLHPDQGRMFDPLVRPAGTMTVALPKQGLLDEIAGDIWLADIGIPRGVFDLAGVEPPPRALAAEGLMRLTRKYDASPDLRGDGE